MFFGDQQFTVLDADGGAIRVADDTLKIDGSAGCLRAHTEHRCVCVGSVETFVDGRHPASNQLHLHSVNGPIVFLHEISHRLE